MTKMKARNLRKDMNDELLPIRTVVDNQIHKTWADWAGMIASIGCAIHCAAMPMVLAYLPALGLGWLAGEEFHRWMAVLCIALAASAFVPGWRKHRSFMPAMWGAAGLLLLTTAAFALEGGCCAACTPEGVELKGTPQCNEAECSLCQADQNITTAALESGNSLAITPFVTPLGGLLLVVGHVSNHRKSCRCQENACCLG